MASARTAPRRAVETVTDHTVDHGGGLEGREVDLADINDPASAWYFGPPSGGQRTTGKDVMNRAWATLSGDIAVVPVPGAVWLFGSALGLLGWARRKTK